MVGEKLRSNLGHAPAPVWRDSADYGLIASATTSRPLRRQSAKLTNQSPISLDHCKFVSTNSRPFLPSSWANDGSEISLETASTNASGLAGGTTIPALARSTSFAPSPRPTKMSGFPEARTGKTLAGLAPSNRGRSRREESPHSAIEK